MAQQMTVAPSNFGFRSNKYQVSSWSILFNQDHQDFDQRRSFGKQAKAFVRELVQAIDLITVGPMVRLINRVIDFIPC